MITLGQAWLSFEETHRICGRGLAVLNAGGEVVQVNTTATRLIERFGVDILALAAADRYSKKVAFDPDFFTESGSMPVFIAENEDEALVCEYLPMPLEFSDVNPDFIGFLVISARPTLERSLKILFKSRFSLLPSEIEMALLLCQGKSVKEISGILRIKESTGRQRLKAIFLKFNVRSQHQLVIEILKKNGSIPFKKQV